MTHVRSESSTARFTNERVYKDLDVQVQVKERERMLGIENNG